jgi:hypothetical protein
LRAIFQITGIIVAAWLLIIAEAYVFFGVIIPLAPRIHEIGLFTLLAALKIGLTLGLGVLWFVVIGFLTQLYVKSKLGRRTPTSSS